MDPQELGRNEMLGWPARRIEKFLLPAGRSAHSTVNYNYSWNPQMRTPCTFLGCTDSLYG